MGYIMLLVRLRYNKLLTLAPTQMKQLTKICGYHIVPPSTCSSKVDLNLVLGMVTFCYSGRTSSMLAMVRELT